MIRTDCCSCDYNQYLYTPDTIQLRFCCENDDDVYVRRYCSV